MHATVVECPRFGWHVRAVDRLRRALAQACRSGIADARWRVAAYALLLAGCALAPLATIGGASAAGATSGGMSSATSSATISSAAVAVAPEWPTQFDGRTLRPLASSAVEQRFAQAFPGAIGRFTDGERLVVLRHVERPTRMLHPATDCYRGLGYRIEGARLERDGAARLWRCFDAVRDGRRLRVCERIVDARGEAFTDTSAWFWAAALGRSSGPWRAVTTVSSLATRTSPSGAREIR